MTPDPALTPLGALVGKWTTEATHPSIDETEWKVWRMSPGFSQRLTGRFSDGGDTISGVWELCTDDIHWANDLAITYRRHW